MESRPAYSERDKGNKDTIGVTELIKGKLKYVPRDLCFHSPFNTRKTRDAKQIERLAERIDKFNFEETRALWVRPVDGRYEVFAGGMRLEAAKLANLSLIPVIPHIGCSDDELAFLAEYDNENDEYHTPVSPVDICAEYARLKSLGWTQQRIAKAKGLKTHTLVSERLRLHSMSDKVKRFVTEGKITEENLREIIQLLLSDKLSPWLTTSQLWERAKV